MGSGVDGASRQLHLPRTREMDLELVSFLARGEPSSVPDECIEMLPDRADLRSQAYVGTK